MVEAFGIVAALAIAVQTIALVALYLVRTIGDAKPSMLAEAIVLLVIAGVARLFIPVFPTDQKTAVGGRSCAGRST
jgi:hypothetical protein